ncbi:MAG: hypothetical protein RLZZ501_1155 [Pseudomonadota bacterium]
MTEPGDGGSSWRRRSRPAPAGPFARYSRFVGIMKVVLPALAAVLLGLVVVWPKLTLEHEGFQIGFAKMPLKEVDTLAMRNAQYYGLNQANRPYALSAEVAVQDHAADGDQIQLDRPQADFTTASGANVVITAANGLYRKGEHTLLLTGDVNLYHDSGTELHTDAATVDLARSTVRGDRPVTGHGPQGTIDAAGFEVTDKGQSLTFTGQSRMTLWTAGHDLLSGRRAAPR